MPRALRSVGVVGLGTMGSGIVEVLARTGSRVVGIEVDEAGVARGREALELSTARAIAGGKLSTTEAAVVEDLEVKQDLFRRLDKVCRPGVVLATTTSSLPVIQLAAVTSRAEDAWGCTSSTRPRS
jgi:3-hydroxybutyryl-CoA dehydrogenase